MPPRGPRATSRSSRGSGALMRPPPTGAGRPRRPARRRAARRPPRSPSREQHAAVLASSSAPAGARSAARPWPASRPRAPWAPGRWPPTRPVHAGAPVDGSSRWWAKRPSARRQRRTSSPDVAIAPGPSTRTSATPPVSGCSTSTRLAARASASVPPKRMSPPQSTTKRGRPREAVGDRVGREALAGPAGVERAGPAGARSPGRSSTRTARQRAAGCGRGRAARRRRGERSRRVGRARAPARDRGVAGALERASSVGSTRPPVRSAAQSAASTAGAQERRCRARRDADRR